mmetsp:Transcript_101689/g.232848  ORF Transcript_101689/g.232848 Transcript_101689/m.232848 type:complete len:199 (+) Transcript_101689:147-743(+)
MEFKVELNATYVVPEVVPTLKKWQCLEADGRTSLFLLRHTKNIDFRFLSCMRLFVLGHEQEKLATLEKDGWFSEWPRTYLVDKEVEVEAAHLATDLLDSRLQKMMSVNLEIRETMGGKSVNDHPTAKVREAETMILVQLVKSMNELRMVASVDHLYARLKEGEARLKPEKESSGDDKKKKKATKKKGKDKNPSQNKPG